MRMIKKDKNYYIKANKEFYSFKSKMGKHLPWFESLHEKSQWDLLFLFKKTKWQMDKDLKQFSIRKFLNKSRNSRKYRVHKSKLRGNLIEKILN